MVDTKIAAKLLEINAIKLSPKAPFTWASGIQSPIYCDNRITLSYPHIRDLIKVSLDELTRELPSYETIAGVATAGIAHGALLADHQQKPFIYVRSKAKGHGRQNLIEGEIKHAQKVLVVEDLISTGGSSIQAVEALRAEGLEVVGVVALFSYEFDKAAKNFEAANCKHLTLSGYSALLQQALDTKYITSAEYETLQNWSQNPEGWSAS